MNVDEKNTALAVLQFLKKHNLKVRKEIYTCVNVLSDLYDDIYLKKIC